MSLAVKYPSSIQKASFSGSCSVIRKVDHKLYCIIRHWNLQSTVLKSDFFL